MGMSLPTVLPEADRSVLMVRVNRATATVREVLRARIILALSEHGVRETARQVGCAKSTVVKWRDRYRVEGLAGLRDRPRSGAPRIHSDAQRRAVAATATSQPPRPWGCWTHARLAERVNSQLAAAGPAATAGGGPVRPVSACWVGRVLRDAHIRVHRVHGWLHRKPDPLFDARIAAIEAAVAAAAAGHSAVICLDEKTAVGVRTPCHRDSYARTDAGAGSSSTAAPAPCPGTALRRRPAGSSRCAGPDPGWTRRPSPPCSMTCSPPRAPTSRSLWTTDRPTPARTPAAGSMPTPRCRCCSPRSTPPGPTPKRSSSPS